MSFTQDELQSFNTILEQKLAIQRRELERTFDQRINIFKREFEQRLAFIQQEIVSSLTQSLSEQQRKLKEMVVQKLDLQQSYVPNETEQKQQLEGIVERALAAQLIAIDQLITQRFSSFNQVPYTAEPHVNFDGIEVQTEIPWDDLAEVVSKVLDERLSTLDESFQLSMKNVENYVSARLHGLQKEIAHEHHGLNGNEEHEGQAKLYSGNLNMQEMFASIEQLEHIIESMQVAMTANHALLSNRIYHHQQLSLERAHASNQIAPTQNGTSTKNQLPLPQDHEKQE